MAHIAQLYCIDSGFDLSQVRENFIDEVAMLKKLRTPDAARALGVSASFLAHLRVQGGGPTFSKLGKVVVYDVRDLETWAEERTRHCLTSALTRQTEAVEEERVLGS